MPRIVLASQSTSRRRLLEDAGLKPTIIVSNVDEETEYQHGTGGRPGFCAEPARGRFGPGFAVAQLASYELELAQLAAILAR
jgi:hypothetical protein